MGVSKGDKTIPGDEEPACQGLNMLSFSLSASKKSSGLTSGS